MPRRIVPLTDVQVRNAKPKEKDYKLPDGYGLYLLVSKTGGRLWRFNFIFDNKPNQLSLGSYPEITLADARQRREDARKLLAHGINPSDARKAEKQSQTQQSETFEVIALEWYNRQVPVWAATHAATVISRLKRDVFPHVGARPISELKATDMLQVFRRIEAREKIETAHRVKSICGQVFRYAVATGRAERDCTADLRGTLTPVIPKHHAALTDPKDVAPFLRAIDEYDGSFTVKCAMRLSSLVFLRPGELRLAEWTEFDLDAGEWNVPIERMKLKKRLKEARKGEKHLVPLARQAVEILKALHPVTGEGKYLFPSMTTNLKPISDNTINQAIRRLGYDKDEMTAHGFRAMARTILEEVLHIQPEIIEHQLAHVVRDSLGRAYNRTTHLSARKKMMQTWADYLDKLKSGAKIIQFPAKLS
ncbi:MAG: integrase arm-type DNA-binding domain-containing protein [Desulfuromonadales bacterium]|nr:integrase arm-type DNA-binding domain-containing protein [Desulfuromonadales bacterium]